MNRALAVSVLSLLLCACAATVRQQAIHVSNVARAGIDAGTADLLGAYCAQQMAAEGRTGTFGRDATARTGWRCVASGPRAGTPRTDPETAAVNAVRAAWAPVLDRTEAVVQAQRGVARSIGAAGSLSDGEIIRATGELVSAYDALRAAAQAANLPVPPALALGR